MINTHQMEQGSKGRLIMIGDHTNNNILIFDKSGNLVDFWGHSFPGGHGLTLSKEGSEDFLFIVDCGYYQDKYGKGQSQADSDQNNGLIQVCNQMFQTVMAHRSCTDTLLFLPLE